MYKWLILIDISLLLLSPITSAELTIEETDPVLVSADMYRVLLENEHVRVVEYAIAAGAKDNWHTHPAKASYVVSGGTLKITTEAGDSFIVEEEMASASWFKAVGKHYAENVGKTEVRIVFVEIKSAKPSEVDINEYRRD